MSLFVACGKFGCSLPQNYATLYLAICSKDFYMKHFSMMENNRQKLTLVSFPIKSSFCANGQFSVFEMALRGWGNTPVEAMGNFAEGIFLLGGGYLTRSDFDHLNLFQS